ncbi:MAG: Mov34/MPN/PAD-1 family protein [Anaerolineales bacterium]|nr:Mov34/MPN/PAD-1 family protein [Anaerolineales bacterium]
MGNLEYVGEWHSHPYGASCLPSEMDLQALQWLNDDVMAPEGLPALMLIMADNNEYGFYLRKMEEAR